MIKKFDSQKINNHFTPLVP